MKKVVLWWGLIGIGLWINEIIKQWLIKQGLTMINSGIAFGLGSGKEWIGLSFFLMIGVVVGFGFNWPTGMIITGALSNVSDRMRWGGVLDYIRLPWLPVFNLADVMILIGVAGLIYKLKLWNQK